MKVFNIADMTGGWFIGDFSPSVFRTKDFEVGVKSHPKGSPWPAHFHAQAIEINYLIKGKMRFGDRVIEAGEIFVFEKNEVATPEFLENCEVLVVKSPSVPGDKILVNP